MFGLRFRALRLRGVGVQGLGFRAGGFRASGCKAVAVGFGKLGLHQHVGRSRLQLKV